MQPLTFTENSGISTLTTEDSSMRNKYRKLKLNIKGNLKKRWGIPLLKVKANSIGVDVHNVSHHSPSHVEILVAGEMPNLWFVINWVKRSIMFFRMNEVLVEFID